MTKTTKISKAFTTGYRFEEYYPGLINQTLPENGELPEILSALKAGAQQHSLDIEHDRLKILNQSRSTDQSLDKDIGR